MKEYACYAVKIKNPPPFPPPKKISNGGAQALDQP